MKFYTKILQFLILAALFALTANAQNFQREFSLAENGVIEIINLYGRVSVTAVESEETDEAKIISKTIITAENAQESDFEIEIKNNRLQIFVRPVAANKRVDLNLKIPEKMRVKIETSDGEVRVAGNFKSADVETITGTIAADVPLEDLKYNFVWTASHPRFLSDVELEEIKEKSAGRFAVKGKIKEETEEKSAENEKTEDETEDEEPSESEDQKPKTKDQKPIDKRVELDFTTARGIILLNVNPNEVPSDLRDRPLTNAVKAIIKSGDSLLTEAVRRASPKNFGDYAATLPPRKSAPTLSRKVSGEEAVNAQFKQVLVQVTDINNRAVGNLEKEDFSITERGEQREILSVQPTTAPFNLVLLLDVSGSVDNYVNFIRKAARNFVNTVSPNDKVSIILFNEDVQTLAAFTTDKGKLSESLDTFDAGGGTAFYDALAFALTETLRPLKGERTAIVVLSDGDDNRSFLPFDSLLGSIQESGALIYPLYVPSNLIAASATNTAEKAVDPLRSRYNGLTSKAESEGEKLAQISGGVYYPISRLSELQTAYDDIVSQLRNAYTITFRSDLPEETGGRASPRLKVKVNKENSFVKLGSVIAISRNQVSDAKKNSSVQKD